MYKYGVVKGDRFCPVYVCSGSKSEREQFTLDVTKIGLAVAAYTKTETEEPFVMALDHIDDLPCMHGCMTSAIYEISNANTVMDALADVKDGPFPELRTFEIPTIWHIFGTTAAKARTMGEAVDQALAPENLPVGKFTARLREVDYGCIAKVDVPDGKEG